MDPFVSAQSSLSFRNIYLIHQNTLFPTRGIQWRNVVIKSYCNTITERAAPTLHLFFLCPIYSIMQQQVSTSIPYCCVAYALESVAPKKVFYYCCKHPGCTYKTIRSGHLNRHERTHTKEKPFKCHLCSYTAARSDHLRRHIKIHYKNTSALSPVMVQDVDYSFCASEPSSPVNSPSPVVSASSSPSLQPALIAPQVPFMYMGNKGCDEGGTICLPFVMISFNLLKLCPSVL